MTASSFWLNLRPATGRILILAALLAVVADAEARGGRRGGGSRSSSHSSSESSGHTINLRPHLSSSSSSGTSAGFAPDGTRLDASGKPVAAGGRVPLTPEEEARMAALIAAQEREQAEKAVTRRLAAEKAEAERVAAEQAAAAQRSAEEHARLAEQQRIQREKAAVDADVDRVLQRARFDYPVLTTPEGEPLLNRIRERQKVLAAKGMYPSVAMVQAVADNEYLLRDAPKAAPAPVAAVPAPAEPAPTNTQSAAFDGCRWVSPIQWSCK